MQITVDTLKKASHYLLLCSLIILGLSSCHDDIEEKGETTETPITQTDIKELTQGDVVGYIYDENDLPISNVKVTVLGKTTNTNEYGAFVFLDIDLDKNGTYIKATKEGYILGSDRIYPDQAAVNHSYIKMLRLTENSSFNAAAGGNILVQGGGVISFPANGIVNSSGESYTGTVNVTAKRIATDDPDLGDVMPGGLLATDKDGATRVLGTLGMVAVELRDDNNNELNLADGKLATVKFPIAEDQQMAAPDQIALWSFDENSGLWVEEGFATREGNNYVGDVSHFSFWNCDAPFPLIHVCGTVLNGDGSPAENLTVLVEADVLYNVAWGWTDSEGRFCGKMPKGEELTITIYYQGCMEEDGYTFTVGPFENDTELDAVTLPSSENGLVTGTVLCDGEAIPNATILVNALGYPQVFLADENGNYSISTSILECAGVESGTIFAINNETNEASVQETFLVGENSSIDLITCGDCDFEITTTIEFTDPCDQESYYGNVAVTGGNEPFVYLWDNNNTTSQNYELNYGLNCVTVTDANGCINVNCIEYNFTFLVDSFLYVQNSTCDLDNGSAVVEVFGGTSPYAFMWSTGSTDAMLSNLAAGMYSVTVTDANGCSFSKEFEVEEELGGIIDPVIYNSNCGEATVSFVSQGTNFNIIYNGEEYGNQISFYEDGTYCFIVSDITGCSEEKCVDIIIENSPVDLDNYWIVCEFPFYNIHLEGDNIFGNYQANDTIIHMVDNTISFKPTDLGYEGFLYFQDEISQCSFETTIFLPNFMGLSTEITSPSCDTCQDGFIDIIIDSSASCIECVVGDTGIYSVTDDGFNEDLSEMNETSGLPMGSYYVVVTDSDTGCIIAHELVQL